MTETRLDHWSQIYATPDHQGSWFRDSLDESVSALHKVAPHETHTLIDVGAGRQHLSPSAFTPPLETIYLLDLSLPALGLERPHGTDSRYQVIIGDVTTASLPTVDLWHDRAVLHFLTSDEERAAYLNQAARSIRSGGGIVISGFAPEGPSACSGLTVRQSSADELSREFGEYFETIETYESPHRTPNGSEQLFSWFLGRRR